MAQVQTTKPATKPATKRTSAKPATKPAKDAKPAQQPAQETAAPVNNAKHHIKDGFRPASGAKLFAYTFAWLQETGLIDGGSISRADAVKLAGSTAIAYHTGKTNTMVDNKGSLSLAPHGAAFFGDRHPDAKDVEAYRAILRTGQPDGTLVKAAHAVGSLKS